MHIVRANVGSCEIINKCLIAASFKISGNREVLMGSAHKEMTALEINCGKPD
jgi:hypothetical protein